MGNNPNPTAAGNQENGKPDILELRLNLTSNDKSLKSDILKESEEIKEMLNNCFKLVYGQVNFDVVNVLSANLKTLELYLSNMKDLEEVKEQLFKTLQDSPTWSVYNNYSITIERLNHIYTITYKDVKEKKIIINADGTPKPTTSQTKAVFELKIIKNDNKFEIFNKQNYNTQLWNYLLKTDLVGTYSDHLKIISEKHNIKITHTNIFDNSRNAIFRKTKEEIKELILSEKITTEQLSTLNNFVNLLRANNIKQIEYKHKGADKIICLWNVNDYYKLLDAEEQTKIDESDKIKTDILNSLDAEENDTENEENTNNEQEETNAPATQDTAQTDTATPPTTKKK